jgi:hypothetical protein
MDNLYFRNWLMEVGQTGGAGGGITPTKLDPLERGTNAFPHYNVEDNPPVGWSKKKMKKDSIKK